MAYLFNEHTEKEPNTSVLSTVVLPVVANKTKSYCKAGALLRYTLKMSVVVCIFALAETLYLHYAPKLVQQTGFYCNDESIRHPFVRSYLTMKHVFYLCLIPPVFIILFVEALRLYRNNDPEFYVQSEDGASTPTRLFLRVCVFYSYFFAAVTFDLLALFFCKFWFGRLRPHFIEVCRPSRGMERCEINQFITDYECRGENQKWITNARMSFFSGHSSLVATTATFMMIYLQSRLNGQLKNQFFLPIAHLLLISATLWTGYSRVADYKHHVSDVLVGFVVGAVIALICTTNAQLSSWTSIVRCGCWRKLSRDHSAKIQPVIDV